MKQIWVIIFSFSWINIRSVIANTTLITWLRNSFHILIVLNLILKQIIIVILYVLFHYYKVIYGRVYRYGHGL